MKIKSDEIRQKFLDYFKAKGHANIGGVSLIPENDPTLLIINSGMAPLKSFFTGEKTPPNQRMCNIQRCVRTNDIESVGDPHHLTFFEMMGNWSIGDYFKQEAIEMGWELIRNIFGFDISRISVTVFGGDERMPNVPSDSESIEVWSKYLPQDRILPLDADSNFWGPTSISGPCGPCTEIFFDRGLSCGCGGVACGPGCGCGRFLEIWNVGVFMQYFMHEDKTLTGLPLKSVDAGAGIERFSLALQGVDSVYETDTFSPLLDILNGAARLDNTVKSSRIIVDHTRATVFMIADGIFPGRGKRDYVLRRLMRRVLLHARLIGINHAVFREIAMAVIDIYSSQYPNLKVVRELIDKVINAETASFGKVLEKGFRSFEKLTSGSNVISGEDAFKLHDTLGFPIEMTKEIAESRGMKVDIASFIALLEQQRIRSKA